jgi:hypothetical protein
MSPPGKAESRPPEGNRPTQPDTTTATNRKSGLILDRGSDGLGRADEPPAT